MRRLALMVLAFGFLGIVAAATDAGDKDAAAVVQRAVKAHFPKGLDEKNKAVRTKTKGTLSVLGMKIEFTQDVSVHVPKFKEVMEMSVMDKKITVTSVYNGKEAWIRAGDTDVPVNDDILNAFKEAAYAMDLMQGAFGSDKTVKYSLVGEVDVKGKKATGVTVSKKGKNDINMFIDKSTGLITKIELRTRDLMANQEVTEERFITEYQEVAGRKVAKKVEVLRDGKEFLTAEVLEVQILEAGRQRVNATEVAVICFLPRRRHR